MINRHELENLGVEAKQLAVTAQAIQDAIFYGTSSCESYFDALSLLTNLMYDHAEKINSIVSADLREIDINSPEQFYRRPQKDKQT